MTNLELAGTKLGLDALVFLLQRVVAGWRGLERLLDIDAGEHVLAREGEPRGGFRVLVEAAAHRFLDHQLAVDHLLLQRLSHLGRIGATLRDQVLHQDFEVRLGNRHAVHPGDILRVRGDGDGEAGGEQCCSDQVHRVSFLVGIQISPGA